ncbi:hypothetical protein [Sharpea azabuensis]|uniref:hypothetical protein n=1 Tax=Sharpea azabuensis TaxID=322505 RepID=UPI0015683F66|nr:hypothetical protein [Sharpea azabuensis]
MYVSKSFSPSNTVLGFLLQKHDIPVRFAELPIGSLMKTVYDKNGGSVILVDPDKVSQISNQYLSDKFLHEMVHALTI